MAANITMASETAYWWNQNYLSMNAGCAANADTIIEVWCAATTRDICCGLCMDNTFAGVGPMIFYMSSSVSTAIAVLLAADEAWGIIILQAIWVTGQFVGLWIPQTAYAKTIPKWVAYLQVPVSMGTIPVMTALVFSPVWEQGGRSVEQLFDLKARQDAFQQVARAARQPKSRWSAIKRRALSRDHPSALPVGSQTARGLLRAHAKAWWGTAPFWAVGVGIAWLIDLSVMVYFYATLVWGNDEPNYWSQPECNSAYTNLAAIKYVSWIELIVLYLLTIWQTVGVIEPAWGAAELVAEAGKLRFRRMVVNVRGARSTESWSSRHPASVQWAATWLAILGWLGTVLGLYVPQFLAGGFLVAGDDPFIPFQVQGVVMIVPHVVSIVRGWRANVYRREQRQDGVHKYPSAFRRHVIHNLTRINREPVNVYDVVHEMEKVAVEDAEAGLPADDERHGSERGREGSPLGGNPRGGGGGGGGSSETEAAPQPKPSLMGRIRRASSLVGSSSDEGEGAFKRLSRSTSLALHGNPPLSTIDISRHRSQALKPQRSQRLGSASSGGTAVRTPSDQESDYQSDRRHPGSLSRRSHSTLGASTNYEHTMTGALINTGGHHSSFPSVLASARRASHLGPPGPTLSHISEASGERSRTTSLLSDSRLDHTRSPRPRSALPQESVPRSEDEDIYGATPPSSNPGQRGQDHDRARDESEREGLLSQRRGSEGHHDHD